MSIGAKRASPELSCIRFSADGQWLERTTSLPNDQVFTVCGWARRRVDTNGFLSIFEYGDGAGSYVTFGANSGGDDITLWAPWDTPTSGVVSPALTYITDYWFYWAISSSATAVIAYAAYPSGVLSSYSAAAIPSWTGTTVRFGAGVQTSTENWNGNIFGVKMWSGRALTAYEIARERWTWKPVEWRNLYAVYPMCGPSIQMAARDWGPHGRHLTIASTPTIEQTGSLVNMLMEPQKIQPLYLFGSLLSATNYANSYPSADFSNNGWDKVTA